MQSAALGEIFAALDGVGLGEIGRNAGRIGALDNRRARRSCRRRKPTGREQASARRSTPMTTTMMTAITTATTRRMAVTPSLPRARRDRSAGGARHAGRGVDRIAQRRRASGPAGLADAAGLLAALDDVHVDRRHLVDAQHAVVVEIGLLHAAVFDGDLAVQRRSEPEDQPALKLRHDGVGIDGDAGIDRARSRGADALRRPRRPRPRRRWR